MAKVEYACADGLAGTVRPPGLTPRNERAFAFTYGAAYCIDDQPGRVAAIRDDDGGSPGDTLAEYAYLGLGRIVTEDYVQPQVKLNYDSDTPGDYAGFDRFGRVIDHLWYAYAASTDRDRYTYGYDRASNRLYRENTLTTGRDELYGYDQVNRLIAFQRGELNATKDGITGTPVKAEEWGLDTSGNWDAFLQNTSGTTDLNQARTHNPVNEITAITATTGIDWADSVHDRNGNMTTIPKPASLADGLTATYDAWNRLVKVKDGEKVIARYEYDGLNRRITSHIDSGAPSNPSGIDTYVHYYHNSAWQILETRQSDTPSTEPETLQPKHQYVWSQRYIDAAVLRDENTSANGLCDDQRLYYLNDANFNVTALLDTSGHAVERYVYSPYGVLTIYDATWTNPRSTSTYANVTLYTGREFDIETGLYSYRNRYYSAELGRFVSRDPIRYEAGNVDLYLYLGSAPLQFVDPFGTQSIGGGPATQVQSIIVDERQDRLFGLRWWLARGRIDYRVWDTWEPILTVAGSNCDGGEVITVCESVSLLTGTQVIQPLSVTPGPSARQIVNWGRSLAWQAIEATGAPSIVVNRSTPWRFTGCISIAPGTKKEVTFLRRIENHQVGGSVELWEGAILRWWPGEVVGPQLDLRATILVQGYWRVHTTEVRSRSRVSRCCPE